MGSVSFVDEVENAETNRFGYPEEVPILTEKDFCRNENRKGDKCCLEGWLNRTFHPCGQEPVAIDYLYPYQERVSAWRKALSILKSILGQVYPDSDPFLVEYNDIASKRKGGLKLLAKVWNVTMAKLGYTEGNPETTELDIQNL